MLIMAQWICFRIFIRAYLSERSLSLPPTLDLGAYSFCDWTGTSMCELVLLCVHADVKIHNPSTRYEYHTIYNSCTHIYLSVLTRTYTHARGVIGYISIEALSSVGHLYRFKSWVHPM